MLNRRYCLIILTSAFFVSFFQTEAAARKQSLTENKTSSSDQNTLDYCIHLNMEVEASYEALPKARAEFDALNKELLDLAENLKAAKEEVDRSGTAARKEYDSKLAYYYSRLPELDEKLELYKKMVRTYQEKSDEFDKNCRELPVGINFLEQGVGTD